MGIRTRWVRTQGGDGVFVCPNFWSSSTVCLRGRGSSVQNDRRSFRDSPYFVDVSRKNLINTNAIRVSPSANITTGISRSLTFIIHEVPTSLGILRNLLLHEVMLDSRLEQDGTRLGDHCRRQHVGPGPRLVVIPGSIKGIWMKDGDAKWM